MAKNIRILIDQLNPKSTKITFSELLKICVFDKDLPHSKGEVYFLVTTLKAMGILEETTSQEFKINWVVCEKLKRDGII